MKLALSDYFHSLVSVENSVLIIITDTWIQLPLNSLSSRFPNRTISFSKNDDLNLGINVDLTKINI